MTSQGLSTKILGSYLPLSLGSCYMIYLDLGKWTQMVRSTCLPLPDLGSFCWSHFEDSFLWWTRQRQAGGWRSSAFSLFSQYYILFPSTEPTPAFVFVLSPKRATKALFCCLSFCLPDRLMLLLYPPLVMVSSFHRFCVLYKRKKNVLSDKKCDMCSL